MSVRNLYTGLKSPVMPTNVVQFVGAGTPSESTSTTHALAEPVGSAANDIMFACMATRIASVTNTTPQAGWNILASARNNNVLVGSTGLPSLHLWWRRRTGVPVDPPTTWTFTHPVAPSISVGQIFGYRGIASTVTPNFVSGVTSATNLTDVSWPSATLSTGGMTGAIAFACVAGGSNSTWSLFRTRNTINGLVSVSSGSASAVTGNVRVGQWQERGDIASFTGARVSLAAFDIGAGVATDFGTPLAQTDIASGHAICLTWVPITQGPE